MESPPSSSILSYILLLLLSGLTLCVAHETSNHGFHSHYYRPEKPFHLLAGSIKGDNITGIRDVKHYLNRFGYLNFPNKDINSYDDTFDDSLEGALLTYQEFFQLNKTGVLDHETVSLMSKPRCGHPDIVTTKITNRFSTFYKLNPAKIKRTKSKLYYMIEDSVPADLRRSIDKAFTEWEPYIPLKFKKITYMNRGRVTDIKVEFVKAKDVLAYCSGVTGPVFHFNRDVNWQVGGGIGGYDIITVSRHEIGHILGLDHSADNKAVMAPYVGEGEVREIGPDDIAGVKALYYGS